MIFTCQNKDFISFKKIDAEDIRDGHTPSIHREESNGHTDKADQDSSSKNVDEDFRPGSKDLDDDLQHIYENLSFVHIKDDCGKKASRSIGSDDQHQYGTIQNGNREQGIKVLLSYITYYCSISLI